MKKILPVLMVMLFSINVSANTINEVNDETNNEITTNIQDSNINENMNKEETDKVKKEAEVGTKKTKSLDNPTLIEDSKNSFYIENGDVYVKGSNEYGQLGLGLSYTQSISEYQALGFMEGVKAIEYSDKTLKIIINDNLYYIVGKNSYSFNTMKYNVSYANALTYTKSNVMQKVTINKTKKKISSYYDGNMFSRVKASYDIDTNYIGLFIYNSKGVNTNNIKAYYSNNYPTKILTNVYNSSKVWQSSNEIYAANGKLTRVNNYKSLNKKKKLINQTKYNSKMKRTYNVIFYYNKTASYVTKKNSYGYNSSGKKTYGMSEKFRNAKKVRSYKWYATYNPNLNIRNGVTKTWYSKKGKVKKIDALVDGITYYSQKNKKWRNKLCTVAPYRGSIMENGCMLSSFAMINSKYSSNVNPGQLKDKGLDCNLNYGKAATMFGYKVQNTRPTGKYTRNINTKFYNSSKLVKNGKKTYTLKEAITRHVPVQVWLTPKKKMHRGHSVVAYRYVYSNGKWDIKIYDPYTPKTPKRSLKDMSSRHYIAKAQVWEKK